MTCIVGLLDKGKVYIGGDSAGVAGWALTVRSDEKVFRNGDFLFGFAGSFRMGQLLRYAFSPPVLKEAQNVDAYMVVDFVDAIRGCLKTGGFASRKDEAEIGGVFLVGFRGQLYEVNSDYQVGKAADGYAAIGCGDELAIGALHATRGRDPRVRVTAALEAAEHHSAGVCGPFVVLSTEGHPVG